MGKTVSFKSSLAPFEVMGILVIALVLGIVAAILPPIFIFALAFLPILGAVTWLYPGLALLVLIAVLYGVIPPWLVPNIPLGGGALQANDLALFCLFVVVAFRSIGHWSEVIVKLKPLAIPLLLLVFLFFLSFIFSVGYFGNPVKHILAETRNFIYWLIIPIVVAIVIIDKRQFDFILLGVCLIGYFISGALVFQHLTGIDILGAGRVVQLVTLDKASDVIRSTSPGIYLVIFSVYLVIAHWLAGKFHGLLAGILCFPLFLGLLVTFGRGVWIATAIGLMFLALSYGRRAVLKLSFLGAFGVALMFVTLFVVKPETGQAVVDRFLSVTEEVQHGSSAEWRYQENYFAVQHLLSSPIVGVGIGGFAHPKFHPMMDDNLLRYVHNGYLYLAVKIGVFGLLIPIFIIWKVFSWLISGRVVFDQNYINSRRALLASFLVPCITSFTQPEWMVYTGVGFFGLVLGLVLSTAETNKDIQ